MRITKHGYLSTTEKITIDELNLEDIANIEELMKSGDSKKCGINKDGNIYFSVEELHDYHKCEYSHHDIVIELPEIIKKAIYNTQEEAANKVRKDIKNILKIR